uniref:Uncharacterized protein n=1 Tax=Euplotes harpa TaxID=151035 RepID=A0A7S3JGB5_9SPIT|mmetsp:Transcript_39028/g.44637  ORF Transcript_39028/g.44637 Transcript_39028/m.44637 type:complete len:178 (+) Transcript_39028:687-1220(+)
MNDTGSKVFYRVQNMGVIYWDYFTGESKKIRIPIEGGSFHQAVCAFATPPKVLCQKVATKHFVIVCSIDDLHSRKFMVYDLDQQQPVVDFVHEEKSKKGKAKKKTAAGIKCKQEKEVLFIYEHCKHLSFLDDFAYNRESQELTSTANVLFLQDWQENNDWNTTMNVLQLEVNSGLAE